MTPPSPCCQDSTSYSLNQDILPTTPSNDLSAQLRGILADCSPRQPLEHGICDDLILPDVDPVASNDAYFLPLRGSRSPRRQKRLRASTLGDINESVDETVCHSVIDLDLGQQPPQPIIAWASDDECDDKDEVVAMKQQHVGHRAGDVLNRTDRATHQSTRSLNSDPAVSLDRPVHCTPVAGGVQSDFVLSSTTRPVTVLYPREAVGKVRPEGDRTMNASCPLSSTVCSRLSDCVLPGDTSRDHCQIESTAKVSSKFNDVFGGDVYNECLATNNDLTCCRLEQVMQDKPSSGEMTRCMNNVADREQVRSTTGNSQTGDTTTDSQLQAVRETTMTDGSRRPDSKQVRCAARSEIVEKLCCDSASRPNNKSGWESSPDTVKLLAELINKISELATRQDQLERSNGSVPSSRRLITDKGSQTDDQRREAGDASGVTLATTTSVNNRHQPQHNVDEAGQNVASQQDEKLLKQTKKKRSVCKSQKPEQMNGDEATKNEAPESTQVIQTAPTTPEPTKLTNSGQQLDDVNAGMGEQRPPTQSVEPSALSACITDNIIHIVRGSSALDDLTVEDLVRQYTEPCGPAARRHQPAVETKTSTEAHSQPVDQSQSRASSGSLRHHQAPAVASDGHSPRPRNDVQRSHESSSVLPEQRRDPETTHDSRQVSPQPSRDIETPQRADNVSVQLLANAGTTQDEPQHSPQPRRESRASQELANSASSLCPSRRPGSQHEQTQGFKRRDSRETAGERREQTKTSQQTSSKTADDQVKLRMQYVLLRCFLLLVFVSAPPTRLNSTVEFTVQSRRRCVLAAVCIACNNSLCACINLVSGMRMMK